MIFPKPRKRIKKKEVKKEQEKLQGILKNKRKRSEKRKKKKMMNFSILHQNLLGEGFDRKYIEYKSDWDTLFKTLLVIEQFDNI